MFDKKIPQALAKNLVFPDRCKHIDTRYHFIGECIAKKEVELKYVMTLDEVANIFTNLLKFEDFHIVRARLGIKKKFQFKREQCY